MVKKRIGLVIDILMYSLLLIQMLYIFTGNNVHEILGVTFFACFVVHLWIKRWWFRSIFRKGRKGLSLLFEVVTVLLQFSILLLMLSSMGVSRFLFPRFNFLGSPDFHRYMATATLVLGVLHGGIQGIRRTEKKKSAYVWVIVLCTASCGLGLFAIPYMNRHFRYVEIIYSEKVKGEQTEWKGKKPLVVYFTRLGNTDFETDVDAVSGASLLISNSEMMGSNQLIADMVCDIIDCDSAAITLTGKRYPSSYNETVAVAGRELKEKARPEIKPIDVTGYDSLILIYPLWWGSIPMPVATFLEQNDFGGKTIYLIATQGSSGYGNSVSEIENLCPGADVIPGTSIYCEDIPDARSGLLELIRQWNYNKK